MKIYVLLLTLLLSGNVFSRESLLFENENYKLINEANKSCSTLYLYKKETQKKTLLNDPLANMVDFSKSICFSKENKESINIHLYPSDAGDTSVDGRYLKINYDLETNVYASNNYQKVDYSRCAIIDLQAATLINEASARDEVCFEDDYLMYVFPNIGLPVELPSLISYIQNHKPTDAQEYELNTYINILLSLKISADDINKLSNILKQNGFYHQATKILSQNNAMKSIRKKSMLYIHPNQETKMYLIEGDKVTILDEKTDVNGQKWYFINYKGKKDINMWVKAEAIDINEK